MIHRLEALSGRHPERFLSALGFLSFAGSARLHFEGPMCIAHVSSADSADVLAERVAHGIRTQLRADLPQWLDGIESTTPNRRDIRDLCEATWKDESADRIAAQFDQTRAKISNGAVQVLSADLTLITGKSYTRKSLGAVPYSDDDLLADLRALLTGAALRTVSSDKGLRFSVTAHVPRLTSGGEEMEVVPLLEHLALAGQMVLSPIQRAITPSVGPDGRRVRRERALSWVCNPDPMPLGALVDIHESPPPGLTWPRFTAPIVPARGGAKYSVLRPAREGI